MNQLTRLLKLPAEYEDIIAPAGEEFENMLLEKYPHRNRSKGIALFYALKPLIPRSVQILVRKKRAQALGETFPRWPIEPYLEDLKKAALKKISGLDIPYIWFWPDKKKMAFVVTHDIETAAGLRNVEKICGIEKKYDVRSSWYIVPEGYRVPDSMLTMLRQEGCEIGIHGLRHDGTLFRSYQGFKARLARIKSYADALGASGFRSPSLLRNNEWIKELPFDYDSSFPDTDPYGPQPGGCMSIFPYFLGNVVEIPVTTPMDHTLFEILTHKDISEWIKKIEWIGQMNGMALVIVHPDYMTSAERFKHYEELLAYVKEKKDCWFTRAQDVCSWWRARDGSALRAATSGTFVIDGPASARGCIEWLGKTKGVSLYKRCSG